MSVCVIVGAGPGIGLAVARRFAREGYTLALIARSAEKLGGYVNELDAHYQHVCAFPADAGDPVTLISTLNQIKTELGDPAVLVHNAAHVHQGLPSAQDTTELNVDFQVNVASALICAQQVLPAMRARQSGTILFTGGGLALNPAPPYAALALTKAALRSLAYSLGAEVEPDGVYVGTVTVAGSVKPGTFFDPDAIAEVYWQLHSERQPREFVFRQEG